MDHKSTRVLLLIGLFAGTVGCSGGDNDGLPPQHACSDGFTYSQDWQNSRLLMVHQEPRLCPVVIPSPETRLNTAGSIFHDRRVAADPLYDYSDLKIYSAGDELVASDEPAFWCTYMNGGDTCGDQKAEHNIMFYGAKHGPEDRAIYRVVNAYLLDLRANLTIKYSYKSCPDCV